MPKKDPADFSRYLIDEYPVQFQPTLAQHIGLNEAIFLQKLHGWVKGSEHIRDGRKWVYNSYPEWQAQLPFWSVPTIQRIVASLIKLEVIIVSRLSDDKTDRRYWYAIDYERLNLLLEEAQSIVSDHTKSHDASYQLDMMDGRRLIPSMVADRYDPKGTINTQRDTNNLLSIADRLLDWFKRNTADCILVPQNFILGLLNSAHRGVCAKLPDPDEYRSWILSACTDLGPPRRESYNDWRKQLNFILKECRAAGRYIAPENGVKDVNGTHQSYNQVDPSSRRYKVKINDYGLSGLPGNGMEDS